MSMPLVGPGRGDGRTTRTEGSAPWRHQQAYKLQCTSHQRG
jgi:hypothetical protein